jgi:uroporphyrin-III C-methyltransferase
VSVYLVGAGPGSAELLTLRAARLLARADVVVHDRLVEPEVLDMTSPWCERFDVGKRAGHSGTQAAINRLLVDLGRRAACVVRLKGGDPFVFGRGGEEFEALRRAGVDCEVVPGVSSAFAAPLVAGIPVTHRGMSRGVMVVTGHSSDGTEVDFHALAQTGLTLVVLMGVERRAAIAARLIKGGLDPLTPVAAVEHACTPRQRVVRASLAELGAAAVSAPSVLVIGEVAALSLVSLEHRLGELAGSRT